MTSRRITPDLPTNMRDLVRLIERIAGARGLGHTSIRLGKGAISLLSADGSTVLGQLGQLPNGQMGFSMSFRGAVQDIRNGFAEDSERITSVDQKAIANAAGIDRVGTWATNAQSTANSANNNANSAHSRVDGLDTRVIKNTSDIGTVGTWATNAQNTANSANNNANSAHGRIDTVDRKADGAQSTANTAVSRANTAQSSANNAYDRGTQGVNAASSAQSTANAANSRAGDALDRVAEARRQAGDALALAQRHEAFLRTLPGYNGLN